MDLIAILLVCISLIVESTDLLSHSDESPKFLEVFKSQELRPGEQLSLKCMATGSPLPMITWQLDDLSITDLNGIRYGDYVTKDSNVISFVNISSVSTEHGGHWTCMARSNLADIRYSAHIHVLGAPYVRVIPNMTLVAHQTIHLKCPVGGTYDEVLWEKNGVVLPDNHRQTLHSNGTLIVRELSRETDGGRYSCIAKYRGDISRRDFYITVREKPVIEPFVVPSLVHTGQRLSITCTVVRGDPPLTIKWLYNNQPIGEDSAINSMIKVHHLTDYSSTLLFETVTKKQRGNYTCLAVNDVGEDKHSTQMIIHEKPRWIIEPTDHIDLVEASSVWVDCSATGFPQPSVQWKRTQSIKSEYRPISSTFQTQVYENGTLFIESVDKKDSGLYLCHVSNGIEPDLSKIIRIQVHISARFRTKFRAETFQRNRKAILVCEASGERPITIDWNRDKQLLNPEQSNRYEVKETVMNEGITSELVIQSIDRSDSALYQCITSNAYGRDETSIQVIVQEPPDTPLDVKVDDISSRSARVSWAPPFSGNSRITKYHIYLKEYPTGISSQKRNITIPGTETVWTISELLPNNVYSMNVAAINSLGISQSSLSINFQTQEEVPSDPPTHIKAHSNSSSTIKISWKVPNNQINFGSIKGYYIGYKVSDSSNVYVYKTMETNDKSSTKSETLLKNLNKSTKYDIVIQAFNSKGAGPPSDPIKVETLLEDRPKTLKLNPLTISSSSIQLEWIRETNDDNSVSEYIIDCKNSGNYYKQMRFVSNKTNCVFNSLFCGTLYEFSIMACNKVGCSERHQISLKTKGSSPQPPDKESLLATINSTFVIINLSAFSDNGCPLQHFQLKYRMKLQTVWTLYSNFIHSSQKSLLIDGLHPYSWYYIQITAYSDAGNSQAEYSFLTLTQHNYNLNPELNEEAVILSDNKNSVLLEFEVILPLTLSGIVVIAVTLLVCVVMHRRHPNDTFHSSNNSRMSNTVKQNILNVDDNVNLCDMDKTTTSANRNSITTSEYQRPQTQKCVYFPTPYATTQIDENLEFVDNNGTVRKVSDCGQYATVKRMTPKMHPKSDLHIYSYAVNSQLGSSKEDSEALITYLVEPIGGNGGTSYGPTPTHCCSFVDNNKTKLDF